MNVQYDLDLLARIVRDLSKLTGIAIAFRDREHNQLVSASAAAEDYCTALQSLGKYRELCRCSDEQILKKCILSGRLETHICHAGLCDAAMPVVKNGTVAGYIILGRIRSSISPQKSKYNTDAETEKILNALYSKLLVFTDEQLQCLYDLLPNILFDRAIKFEPTCLAEDAAWYIEAHLNENLNIDLICSALHVSKNNLYRSFHAFFDMTVNQYITECRIEKAKHLLKETDQPVYAVAEAVGIPNYTYFCRMFKRNTGFSPGVFRKN